MTMSASRGLVPAMDEIRSANQRPALLQKGRETSIDLSEGSAGRRMGR
jgi:hypothetical protein